tara:strand:- start:214 stop:444 length:231 start_codon:yes stop_codon:yes gene_type:complete
MEPIQALDMLNQVVKSIKLPYQDHVLLERSVDVLREELQNSDVQEPAELLQEDEPVVFEEEIPKAKKNRRGGRRKK